jgi:CHAD domain-containing protein
MAKAKPVSGLHPRSPTGKNARIIARARLEEMYTWARYADKSHRVQELHDLRIAAKRLRYSLEVFEEFLPRECQAIVQELAQLQEELGLLHDSDVIIALLRLQGSGATPAGPLADTDENDGLAPPALLADLLDPARVPEEAQRYGLDQKLLREQLVREQRYTAFQRHWRQLQERNFRREILDTLDA